ncbi:N-6 DNA methylase [Actinomadura geliboluensis]|uniref:N-6 DNA methylase n=1 Tax=Actinomadura geliboluensis TaxID=882440 RepID=UPI0036752A5B
MLYELPYEMKEALESLRLPATLEVLQRSGALREIVAQIFHIVSSFPDQTTREALVDLFVASTGQFASELFHTPTEVALLASKIVLGLGKADSDSPANGFRVLDPRMGYGEMVLALLQELDRTGQPVALAGFESSVDAAAIAQMSLFAKRNLTPKITYQDWLTVDNGTQVSFDYLVSAIPISPWRFREWEIKRNYIFPALPKTSDSTLLYIWKAAHEVMRCPQTRAVLVVNSGALVGGAARSGDARLRSEIIASGALRAMILLPSKTYESTGVAPCILLLSREAEGVQVDDGFVLVDARKLGTVGRRRRMTLSEEEIERVALAVVAGDEKLAINVSYEECAASNAYALPPFGVISGDGKARPDTLDPLENEVRLENLCEVLPGRNRVGKDEDREPECRVVRAEDITTELAPHLEVTTLGSLEFEAPNGRTYTHGTITAYSLGKCKCDHCQAAYATYRAKRRASGKDSARHPRAVDTDPHIPANWFRKSCWYPARDAAGLDWSPRIHDLRHAHASWLLAGGADLQVVKERLGHLKLATTEKYLHSLPNADETALTALDKIRSTAARSQAEPPATDAQLDTANQEIARLRAVIADLTIAQHSGDKKHLRPA